MNPLFTHISDNTLTEEFLMGLMAQGCDIDGIDSELGTTPLLWAYDKGNNSAMKLLLGHGANMDAEDVKGATIATRVRERNDIYVQLLLSEYKGRRDYLQQRKIEKEEWEKEYQERVKSGADDLNNRKVNVYRPLEEHTIMLDPTEPEYPTLLNLIEKIRAIERNVICRTMEQLITTDSVLQTYPELLSLLEKITVLKYNMDLTGGNADNKSESAVIELATADKHRLVYSYWYNWSYDETNLFLDWYANEKEIQIWAIDDGYKKPPFSDDVRDNMSFLAQALGLGHLPLEHFSRFLIILLSRMVQIYWFDNLEDHGIYLRLREE